MNSPTSPVTGGNGLPSPFDSASNYVNAFPCPMTATALGDCAKRPKGEAKETQLLQLACHLIHGYGLNESEALELLRVYNRRCSLRWSEPELRRTVASAEDVLCEQPGYLLGKPATQATAINTKMLETPATPPSETTSNAPTSPAAIPASKPPKPAPNIAATTTSPAPPTPAKANSAQVLSTTAEKPRVAALHQSDFRLGVQEIARHLSRLSSTANCTPAAVGFLAERLSKFAGRLGEDPLPEALTWEELTKPISYEDALLGDRFLERGQGLILFGPSGCGKSVAVYQAASEWCAGLEGLHITPAFPLKIVLIQTEDSLNECRECLQGILTSELFTADKVALLKKNLIILPPLPGGNTDALASHLNAAGSQYRPDMIIVNPLQAYCAGDPAKELGGLLYQAVDPIIKKYRTGFCGVDHTTKTINRDTRSFGAYDWQYLAAGDARVANWPRAMIQIEPMAKGVYRFRAPKRWRRTGWTWEGKPTQELYFQHSPTEIRWLDATPEEAAEAHPCEDYRTILGVLPTPDQTGISRERVRDLAKKQLKIGKHKADSWLKLAQEDGAVEPVESMSTHNRKTVLFRRKETGREP